MTFRLIVLLLVLSPLTALSVTVGELPPCDYADTEVSTNFPFTVRLRPSSFFEFALSVDASPSNAVEVAIGTDADGDGNLAPEESAHVFGYDCGLWFERTRATSSETRTPAEPAPRPERTFAIKTRDLDPAWNFVKVTRRGFGTVGERADIRHRIPGFRLLIR